MSVDECSGDGDNKQMEHILSPMNSDSMFELTLTDKFIVNELLAYVSFYRDKADHNALRSTLMAF